MKILTTEEGRALLAQQGKRNKYNAVKVKDGGYTFDSKAEHARWCLLVTRQRIGEISDLEVHPKFVLRMGDDPVGNYTADFSYIEKGNWIVEDVKSKATHTEASRMRMKLFRICFPSAQLRVVITGRKQ